MAKGAISIKDQPQLKRRVEDLGKLSDEEERAPKGVSPFDIGEPPALEPAAAELEQSSEAAPDAAASKTHEEWARLEGYLPARWRNPAAVRNGRLRGVAPTPNPKHWIYAGALAGLRWPIGKEMTLAEFRAAIAKAHDFKIRG